MNYPNKRFAKKCATYGQRMFSEADAAFSPFSVCNIDGTALPGKQKLPGRFVLLSCSPPCVTMGTVGRGGARMWVCVSQSRGVAPQSEQQEQTRRWWIDVRACVRARRGTRKRKKKASTKTK